MVRLLEASGLLGRSPPDHSKGSDSRAIICTDCLEGESDARKSGLFSGGKKLFVLNEMASEGSLGFLFFPIVDKFPDS